MRHMIRGLCLILIAFSLFPAALSAQENAPDVSLPGDVDIRFVVDVSGSMQRTDPNNLRRPAVSMVAELMPRGSRGGVWTFARYVNMLVPLDEVDDAWRREVRGAVSEIGSPGQYTNIGEALDTVTEDFWPGGDYSDTHVVVLTDGMVDVPDGEQASQRERERILDSVVERFREHGATLHTMALSQEADHSLLEQLAVATGGQYAVAESDEELTRAFLSAFDAASPTEEVPLSDNGFEIDGTVEEFTALIFREEGGGAAELLSPSGERYSSDRQPGEGRWHATGEYDLVTIPEPESGRWEVDAIVGPDSRVKVVSELRMAVNELPAQFFASDSLPLSVAFFEEGDRLRDSDFLGLLDLRVEIRDEAGGRRGTRQLSSGEPPANGVFRDEIATLNEPGRYRIRIVADGETFQRSERQTVELRPPFDTEVQARGSGEESRYQFRVMARDPGIERDTVSVTATVTQPDGSTVERSLESGARPMVWEWLLDGDGGEGTYRVALEIRARTQKGRAIDQSLAPFEARIPRDSNASRYLTLRRETPQAKPAPAPEPKSEPEPEPKPDPEPESRSDPLFAPEPVTPPQATGSEEDWDPAERPWLLWGAGLLAAVVLIGGGMGFWLWRRRRAGAVQGKAATESKPDGDSAPEPEAETEAEPELPERDDGESLAAAAAAYQEQQVEEEDGAGVTDESAPEEEPDPEPAQEEIETAEDAEEPTGEQPGEEDEPEAEEQSEVAEEPQTSDIDSLEPDESIPTLDETQNAQDALTEPEPEPEPETAADVGAESADTMEPESGEDSTEEDTDQDEENTEMDADALADQILEENQAGESADDEEFSLEDFDISEFDDLPEKEDPKEDGDKGDNDEGNR